MAAAIVPGLLLALAAVGFLDALYFVLVTYRVIPPDPRWLPNVCRMDEATCARVVDTPYARVFGLPNAVYGLAWYAIVGAAAAGALASGALPFCAPLVVASAATVAFSAYLAWSLLVKLRTPCPLCFLGHGVNAAILAALVAGCRFTG